MVESCGWIQEGWGKEARGQWGSQWEVNWVGEADGRDEDGEVLGAQQEVGRVKGGLPVECHWCLSWVGHVSHA